MGRDHVEREDEVAGVVGALDRVADLDEHKRNEFERLTTKGNSSARKIRRARILLLADEGRLDKEIASFLGSAVTTVERVRKEKALRRRGLGGCAF